MIYEAAIIQHNESTLIINEDMGYQSFERLVLRFRHILWDCYGEIREIDRVYLKNTYNALKENAKANDTDWPKLKIPIHFEGHTSKCDLKYDYKHSS